MRIGKDSRAAGRSLAEIDLRSRFGVSVLMIQRGAETIINPGGEDRLESDDQVIVLGRSAMINQISDLFCKEGVC